MSGCPPPTTKIRDPIPYRCCKFHSINTFIDCVLGYKPVAICNTVLFVFSYFHIIFRLAIYRYPEPQIPFVTDVTKYLVINKARI